MAANLLTVGSKFQPFSFAEMIAPLQIYQQEYQRQEDMYNQYAEQAGVIGSQLNPEYDQEIIDNVLNPYMNAISQNADILAKQGLSVDTRRNLQALKRQFGHSIAPIKLAADARAKARDNWDNMLKSDKTLMTTANPYYQGISSYMNGDSPETAYASGTELYSRGKALAEAFSKTQRDVPESINNRVVNGYIQIVSQFGADSEEASQFMAGVTEAIPELGNQIQDILNNSGIGDDSAFSDVDKNKARQYIIEGMKSGLSGSTKDQYLQDWLLREAMRNANKSKKKSDKESTESTQYRGNTYQRTGSLYEDASKFINSNTFETPLVTRNGIKAKDRVEATALARDNQSKINDVQTRFNELFSQSINEDYLKTGNYKTITSTIGDYKYEVTYNKPSLSENHKVITVRKAYVGGENFNGMPVYEIDNDATEKANKLFKEYADYSFEYDDLAQAGILESSISEKEERKLREKFNIANDVDLDGFVEAIRNNPESKVEDIPYVNIDAPGSFGKPYRDSLTSSLQNAIESSNPNVKKDKMSVQKLGNVYYLDDRRSPNGLVEKASDVFEFGDDGSISNIVGYTMTAEALSRGDLVVQVHKNNKNQYIEVPVSAFGNLVNNFFNDSQMTGKSYVDTIGTLYRDGRMDEATSMLYEFNNQIGKMFLNNFLQAQPSTFSPKFYGQEEEDE